MNTNSELVSLYFSNIDDKGGRIRTWVKLGELYGVKARTLTRISSIRKHCDDVQFGIFTECMHGAETVLFSNGTSSYNIDHISVLLRAGYSIVGEGKPSCSTDNNCIYLLHVDNHYRLGTTLVTAVDRRIGQLQTGNPHLITLVFKTGVVVDANRREKLIRKGFKTTTAQGGWFTLTDVELKHVLNTLEKY